MFRLKAMTYFSATFMFVGAALFLVLQQTGLFEVSSVPVELVSDQIESGRPAPPSLTEIRLKERIVNSLRNLRGKRIWEVDIGALRSSLSRDEWVKDVLISRSFPNEVRVIVRPKSTVMALTNKYNEFIPVTEDGALLSAIPAGSLPDVPVLNAEAFQKDSEKRRAAAKFLSTLPSQGPLTVRNISEIGWSGEDGFILTLIQPKVEVKLGEDRVDLKALRAAQVMNYLSANNLKGRVIDASFSKKVLVRLRKGP